MKILILTNSDAGLYKFRKELIEELVKEHEVYASSPCDTYKEEIKNLGCKIGSTKLLYRRGTNPKKDLTLLHYYLRLLKKIKPGAVITFTIKPTIYGGIACSIKNIPYISCITGLGTAIENGGFLSALANNMYKVSLKKASCIFFENKSNMDFFADKKITTKNTRLVQGAGVDLKRYPFLDYPEENDEIRFLYVARIMKDKGIDELLEAFTYIKQKYPYTKLDIVGGYDEDYSEKINKAQQADIIKYYGERQDITDFYKKAHCIVLPSYHEGMSNVLQEASSSGRPVIASDVPGCREIVDDKKSGFLCKRKDASSLIEAFEKFIALSREERKNMGMVARKKMENEFDRKYVVEAYIEEILRIRDAYEK